MQAAQIMSIIRQCCLLSMTFNIIFIVIAIGKMKHQDIIIIELDFGQKSVVYTARKTSSVDHVDKKPQH